MKEVICRGMGFYKGGEDSYVKGGAIKGVKTVM